MSESLLSKNLADKRKQIMAYIGSLEQELEQARRDLSAIVATERVFQARGPNVTAYMHLAHVFPRHELPKLAKAGLEATPDGMSTVEYETKAKNLLRGQLRLKGITTAQLAEKLGSMGIQETERNLNNKISRGGFTAAFLIQCLLPMGSNDIRLN